MRRGRGRRSRETIVIARERMELLMVQADLAALDGELDLADRYVDMARRVGMRYNVRFRPGQKRKFCRACHRYLLPGSTARTRLNRGRSVTTCLHCGHVMRRPLKERDQREGSSQEG